MRRPFLPLLAAIALVATSGVAIAADPRHGASSGTTDDPADAVGPSWFQAAGGSFAPDAFLDTASSSSRADRKARNISLVGSLALTPQGSEVHADVAGYKNLAFVGKWRGLCPGTGVDVIDISRPANPVKIADTRDYADTSMEDMAAVRIGNRDVLGIGLQDCAGQAAVGTSGFELYDISDPANPQFLSLFDVDQFADVTGVHELDITKAPGGRTLALLAVPDIEAITSDEQGLGGTGDLLILDISDPANPVLVGEWGVLDEPGLGVPYYLGVRRGADGRTLLHSVRANQNGTLAYLSYWDGGFITLDISDPADPQFLGVAPQEFDEDGNAHSSDEARGGNLLLAADEDGAPFHLEFTSSAFAGTRPAVEGEFTPPVVNLPGRQMSGEVVHIGRACPPGTPDAPPGGDPLLADPTGKIALIERGLCRFDNKIAWAQLNGAVGAIVYNNAAGGEALVLMGGENPVLQGAASVIGTTITIPGFFVQRSTGLLLVGATPPLTATASAVFDGWGYLRIYDTSDPANAVQLAEWHSPGTDDPDRATLGTFTVHNPEVRGNQVFTSWYSEGFFVIDISNPSAPRDVGQWSGEGAPAGAPPVNIWSVVPHGGLLLASDRNYGLYILKLTP
ncbi:MAG: PA domain-containing protein [Acidimicrobiales bacterium]